MMHDDKVVGAVAAKVSVSIWRHILLGVSLLFALDCHASFSLEATRVIYDEKARSAQVTASNSGEVNYLVQSWVENSAGQQSNDFVVVPPFFKLNGGEKNAIQIVRNIAVLPADRESLYWLNSKFVAPSRPDEVNVLRYSVTNKIKLIYRPQALRDMQLATEVKRLVLTFEAGQLQVKNPTGVYINVNDIYLDGRKLSNPGYFAPFSTTRIRLGQPHGATGKVRLNYINDYGASLVETFGI